jgi:DNA invertase Pin-like site-specific DNA recombinase
VREFLNIMEDWERIGVSVHVMNFMGGNAIDFSSPAGKLFATMLVAIAEFERSIASERTKETMRHLAATGGATGHPRYGFKYEKRIINGKSVKRCVKDVEERKQMREMLRMRTEDPPYSWHQIREHLAYELKWYRTKNFKGEKNRHWSLPAMIRACKWEAILQYREATQNAGSQTRA